MKSPFKFLDAFTLSDKDAFFGRDQEIEISYNTVYKTPLVLIYGSSGTGKTSLIQCGLGNRFDGPDWYPIFIRRNDNLNESLAEVMRNALGDQAKGDLTKDVSLLLRKSLRPVYLLFDQFEELFIRGSEEEQIKFMTDLRALLDAGLPCKVALIMREEFIAQLYTYEELIPELFDHRFRVEAMGPSKVKKVISSSFEKFNILLAEPKEELLDLMVANINDPKDGITLPYLQVYLDMLYRDVHQKKFRTKESEGYPQLDITRQDIDSLGRIDNVLERFLEDQTIALQKELDGKYTSVNPKFIQTVLNVFVTDEGTKNPVSYRMEGENVVLSEEASMFLTNIPAEMLTDILTTLNSDRILRKGDKNIELAHDSLALVIHKRKSESDRLLQSIRKRLLNAYDEYKKTGAFLNEKQLSAFDQFSAQMALTPELEKFLGDCEAELARQKVEERDRALQENKMAQQKKLARTRMVLFGVIALLVIGAAWSITGILKVKNDSLTKERDFLADEKAITEHQRDSITQIIDLVDQQISKMDSTLSGELPRFHMAKYLIKLKSLVRNNKLSDAEMKENYASLIDLRVSDSQDDEGRGNTEPILKSKMVFLSLHLKTPQKREFIEVNWREADSNKLISSSYQEVIPHKDSTTALVGVSNDFKDSGKYIAEVLNSQGVVIGKTGFGIADVPVNNQGVKWTEYSDFRTMKSGSLDNPGPATTVFNPGDKLNYWLRINSPKPEQISVQLQNDDGKIIWTDRYTTEVNEDKGSRKYSWHGLPPTGAYYIRLLNSRGFELAGFAIQVKGR